MFLTPLRFGIQMPNMTFFVIVKDTWNIVGQKLPLTWNYSLLPYFIGHQKTLSLHSKQ